MNLKNANQFVHPAPKACLAVRQGSQLIFRAPFRDGVNTENQLMVQKYLFS